MWHYFSLPSCTSVFSLFDWHAPSSQSSLSTRKSNLYLLPSYWLSSFLLHQSSLSGNITQQFLAYDSLFWNSFRILEMKSDQQVSWCPRSLFCQLLLPPYFVRPLFSHLISSNFFILSFVGSLCTFFDLPCALQWGLCVESFWTYHVLFSGTFLQRLYGPTMCSSMGHLCWVSLNLPCALQWGISVASFWTYHVLQPLLFLSSSSLWTISENSL